MNHQSGSQDRDSFPARGQKLGHNDPIVIEYKNYIDYGFCNKKPAYFAWKNHQMLEKRDFENRICQFNEFSTKIVPDQYDSSVSTTPWVPKIRINGGPPVFQNSESEYDCTNDLTVPSSLATV